MKRFFYTLLFIFTIANASAQSTIFELMERTDISLQEIETIAKRHFDTAGTERGSGYKQYQRWLYERRFHTDEYGNYISPKTDWDNYIATRQSNFIEAGNWTEMGPMTWNRTSSWNPGTGRLAAVAMHPANESVIYVGSPGGGMWKTVNGGTTWQPLTDNNALWMSFFAITIDPTNQNVVYAGTSGSNGLLKSTNAGTSWALTGSGPTGTIRKILIHPSTPNTVFACASNGIFRSTNGGTNWTQVHTGSKEDIEFKPDDLNIMYATGSDVYRSVDNGVNWTLVGAAQGITNTGRTLVSVSAANPNYVYVVQASGNTFGRMYKSTDAGLTFITTVVGNPAAGTNYFGYETSGMGTGGQATYDMAMDVSPTNAAEVYIAGIICWKSVNEATSFVPITAWSLPNTIGYNHADVHGLFWVNSTIYSISDGGLFKSVNNGDDWVDISNGLGIRQFYRFSNSQTNANVITGGAQDNGSAARQASGLWVDWLGADGMEGLVSPTNHLNLWGTSQNGSIYRSTNGGNSYSGLPRPAAGDWVTPIVIHPTNETILYGGWTGVWKSITSGTSWTNISSGVITTLVTDLAIAPSAPTTLYASRGSVLYVTTDDGANWTTRTAPASINDIFVDATNPNKIWIACNSTTNRVFVSTDGGANFTNISSNLPAITARTIVVDDKTPRGIYVGMNVGVFFQEEGAASWTNYSDNLPAVAINELEIQKASGKIRVATYGRGVWESPEFVAVPNGFSFTNPAGPAVSGCPAPATMTINLGTNSIGGFTNPITLAATAGVPAGTTVTFGTNPVVPGNSSTVNLNNASSLAPGSYIITITGTASGAASQNINLVYTINAGAGPAVTAQPVAQTLCTGLNTSFSVASPTATGFQWQLSTTGAGGPWTNISNGGVYSNATTATLNITGVLATMNNYQYRCVANIVCGATNSNPALLTVQTPPSITSQPSNTTACVGNTSSFCVTATGSGLVYQWQVNSAGCAGGAWTNLVNSAPYSGVNTACLTINPTSTMMNGYGYRCVVSGDCAPSAASNCGILAVNTPVAITAQPANSTVCAGASTSFTVAASGTTPTYQWQESTNGGASWNNINNGGVYSGATTTTLSLTGVTGGMSANQYRVIVSGAAPCSNSVNSNATILTVQTAPLVTGSPTNSTVYTGGVAVFSVTAVGTSLTYQWQFSTGGCNGTWANVPFAPPYSGVNTGTLTINPTSTAMSGYAYRCLVSGTCAPAATSGCAILTVNTPVTVVSQPAASVTCSGSNTSFTVVVSGTTPSFQWQVSINGGAAWNNITNGGVYSGATTATLNLTGVTAAMTGNQYRCVVTGAAPGGFVNSNPAVLNVTPQPVISATITALLAGQQSVLSVNIAPAPGLSFTWYLNNVLIPGANGNSIIATVNSLGSYRVVVTSGAGSCQSLTQDITAKPSADLFIFPNPNDGLFTVTYYTAGASITNPSKQSITIYNARGQLVHNKEYEVRQAYQLHRIDMRPNGSGVYFIVLREANGNKIKTGEVVIQ